MSKIVKYSDKFVTEYDSREGFGAVLYGSMAILLALIMIIVFIVKLL